MGEMHEASDARLLRDYAERGDETAFRELVARHTGVVYSAACRQVGSPDLARDVAQRVFTDLARKAAALAPTLSPNASVVGWLHRATRLASLTQLREDRRREARERQAMNWFDAPADAASAWERLAPVLDEALAALNDADRDALLLRFFQGHDFRAIGQALGVSDDAAQKRVSRALEKLRAHLARRGVTATTATLTAVLATNAVAAAPCGLAGTLSAAALAEAAVSASTALVTTQALAMTTLQKTLIGAALLAAVGTGIYEAHQAARLRGQMAALEREHAALIEQTERLTRERDAATRRSEARREATELSSRDKLELLQLRGEVTRLRQQAREWAALKAAEATPPSASDPTASAAQSWVARVERLRQRVGQTPGAAIPEFGLLAEEDWLSAARNELTSETDYRKALSELRRLAESKFAALLQPALHAYLEAHAGQFPADLSELQPYLKPPADAAMLERYAIVPAEELPSLQMGGDRIITQKAPVDAEFDPRIGIGPQGYGITGPGSFQRSR